MRTRNWIRLGLAMLLAFGAVGCSKNRKAGGFMDDPMTHYMQGKKYWDKGEFDRAREEFNLSKSLDKKFCPAWAGLAMTDAAEGKIKAAEDNADEAEDLCGSKGYEGYMAQAIVLEYKFKGNEAEKDWWEDAESYYKKALKIAPSSGELYYRMGRMYKVAYEFRKSEDAFKKNLELKNDYQEQANAEWAVVQKILRAAPGTRVGQKIALIEKITRADIAALFINELELDRILDKRMGKSYDTDFQAPTDPREMQTETVVKMAAITDMDGHWAKNFAQDLQKYRIRGLEPTPDHKFHPGQSITRGEYAFFIEDILIAITGEKDMATKHIGATASRFPDVNVGSPYYNAICNAVDKNVMDAALDGEFRALDSVTGPDALLIIRAIKDMRR